MSKPSKKQLLSAYEATIYWCELPAGYVAIRCGQACVELDTFLLANQFDEWAFITAHNPQSILQRPADNHAANQRLEDELQRAEFTYCLGLGVGDGWPPEASFLVCGISPEPALRIAERYDQKAIVVGRRDQQAALRFVGD